MTGLEGVDAHAVEDAVAQDAGIVDHAVELPKVSSAVLTIRLAGTASATLSKFATAVPPRFLISSTTSSAGRGVRALAVGGDAGIVDHDLGALGRAQQRDLAPDAAPRAGDDDGFAFQ